MSDSKLKQRIVDALEPKYEEEKEEDLVNKRGKTTFHARRNNGEKKELILEAATLDETQQ